MFCSQCGKELGDADTCCPLCERMAGITLETAPTMPSNKQSTQVLKSSIAAYASGNTRAYLASFFLISMLIIDFVAVVFRGIEYEITGRMMRGDYWTMEEISTSDDRIAVVSGVYIVFFIITAIVFLVWIYRAYRNLSSFGCSNLKHSPAWAVGWFFIPVANLWKCYMVITEIWKASNPNTDINDSAAWQFSPVSLIIPFWWFSFVAKGLLSRITQGFYNAADEPSELHTISLLLIIVGIIEIISIILAIINIQSINNRQEKKRQLILSSRVK